MHKPTIMLGVLFIIVGGFLYIVTDNLVMQGDTVVNNPLLYEFKSVEYQQAYYQARFVRNISYFLLIGGIIALIGGFIAGYKQEVPQQIIRKQNIQYKSEFSIGLLIIGVIFSIIGIFGVLGSLKIFFYPDIYLSEMFAEYNITPSGLFGIGFMTLLLFLFVFLLPGIYLVYKSRFINRYFKRKWKTENNKGNV